MEDTTTTEAPIVSGGQSINGVAIDDQGMAIPQPDDEEQAEAVQETTESEQQAEEAPASAPEETISEDAELASWAEKKGLKLDSENTTKAAKMAREAERAMHAKAQKASELERTLDNSISAEAEAQGLSDDDRVEIARIRTRMNVRDFWDSNPEAREYEQAMVAELQAKPHLAGDLESLYANAVLRSGGLSAVKSQGKKEALETLAHKQQAATPRGSAVTSGITSDSITPQNVDYLVATNDQKWFEKNYDKINKAMAG